MMLVGGGGSAVPSVYIWYRPCCTLHTSKHLLIPVHHNLNLLVSRYIPLVLVLVQVRLRYLVCFYVPVFYEPTLCTVR